MLPGLSAGVCEYEETRARERLLRPRQAICLWNVWLNSKGFRRWCSGEVGQVFPVGRDFALAPHPVASERSVVLRMIAPAFSE